MSRADEDGYDDFFLTLLPGVNRVALRLVGDLPTAEDVVAEAFARAFASWGRVSRLSYRDAWLMRVATNLALDAVKRRPTPLLHPRHSSDPADEVVGRLVLTEALKALPKRQRQAVVMRYLADLPEEEVGEALGVSPGTVKAHLHRGREALSKHLDINPEDIEYGTHPA